MHEVGMFKYADDYLERLYVLKLKEIKWKKLQLYTRKKKIFLNKIIFYISVCIIANVDVLNGTL